MLHSIMRRLIRPAIRVLIAIVLVLVVPVFILLSLPIFLVRYLAQKLAKVVRPDLVQMLAPCSSLFAQTDSLDDPKSSIVSQFIFEGQVEADEFIEAYQQRLIDFQDSDGSFPYAKFHQYIVDWMGFKFWREEDNFDIRNHIKIHPAVVNCISTPVTENDLLKFSADCVSQPYDKTRSPWEIYLVPSIVVDTDPGRLHTAAILRLNHVLADGYSIIKLTTKFLETAKPMPSINPDAKISKPNVFQRVSFLFKFFYRLAEIVILTFKDTLWKVSPSKLGKGQYNVVAAKVTDCQTVKQAKNQHNVAFTSVVYTALTTAIRNLSLKKGMKIGDGETMPLMIPIPKPRHPGGLVNHYTLTLLELPVGESSSLQRLLTCNASYDKLKTSVTPFVTGLITILYGSYFTCIGKHLKNFFSGMLVSYLPTGFDNVDFSLNGRKMLSTSFFLGIQHGCSPISIGICSLGEDIRATVVADDSVFSKDEIALLLEMISEETQLLANLNSLDETKPIIFNNNTKHP